MDTGKTDNETKTKPGNGIIGIVSDITLRIFGETIGCIVGPILALAMIVAAILVGSNPVLGLIAVFVLLIILVVAIYVFIKKNFTKRTDTSEDSDKQT